VVKRVAEQLGNTPAVCRKSYIHLRSLAAISIRLVQSNAGDDRGEHPRARTGRRRGDAPAGGMDCCRQAYRRRGRAPGAGGCAGKLTKGHALRRHDRRVERAQFGKDMSKLMPIKAAVNRGAIVSISR
jgi:hypothetical protein